jgi:hypothetical protein
MIGNRRLLVAIPVVAGLAITMGAPAASAAPAHQISPVRTVSSLPDIPSAGSAKLVGGKLELPAQTAADCAVVYIKGSSADLYLTAEGLNNVVEATSGSRDCWSTATFYNYGNFIYNGSGRCLAENADLNRVVMQNCGDDLSWQLWLPDPGALYRVPGTIYWNGYTGKFLATNTLTSGTYVYATGTIPSQWSEWYS